jgi:hypothetical protein
MYDLKPRCGCGKYSGYNEQVGIPYGCKYTPDPEPLDEEYFCNKCAEKEKNKFKERILQTKVGEEIKCIWWQRPKFIQQALKETGFSMIRSSDNQRFILQTQQTNNI